MKLKRFGIDALKGFSMGAGVFPGVSAGTIALMTGIFQPMLDSLNALLTAKNWKMLLHGDAKGFWKAINGNFLLALGIGTLLGFVILARVVEYTLANFPIPTWAFFFGLILVSTIYLLADIKGWKFRDALMLLIGIAIGVGLCLLSPAGKTNTSPWYTFISGALGVCSMILPGISGSFILVMLGNFDYMIGVLNSLQWGPLLIFGLGCVVGLLAFSKFLHWLLDKHERPTMLVLFGLVLGFLVKIWPWADKAAIEAAQVLRTGSGSPVDMQIPAAAIAFAAGALLIVLIEAIGKKKDSPSA